MRTPLFRIAIAAALLAPVPAFAGKKIDDVKSDGFKCERVAVNYIICSKPGSKDYTCDDTGQCEQLRVLDPGTGGTVKPPRVKGGLMTPGKLLMQQ